MKSFRTSTVISFFAITCFAMVVGFAQTRPRPAATAPATDFKVKYKVTFSSVGGPGQSSESVTMIKGARERSESRTGYGYDTINITQCDTKRMIQISETAKKYFITPIVAPDSPTPAATPSAQPPATPTRRGGTVTYVTSSVDTGERREMFGFTARHVKTSMRVESSPDACNPINQRYETDGWYIDLNVAFNCNVGRPPVMTGRMPVAGGCVDQTKFRTEGSARTGYPLIETMKVFGPDGQVTFSTSKEVIELSREPLDMALFEIPAGYTEAATQQELFAVPSMTDVMSGATQAASNPAETTQSSTSSAKPAGVLRVGVVQINNKAGKPISQEALRQKLIADIQSAGIDAIPLNGISPAEVEVEAKAKSCDYILYSDLTALKTRKLGGMFGRVTGVGVGKTEAKVEYRLFAVGEASPKLQSSASAKEEGEDTSASTAISAEARAVIAEVKKGSG